MRILYQLTSPMDKTVGSQEVARRQAVLQDQAATGTEVVAEPIAKGPAAIESAHDAGLVVPELIRLAPRAEKHGFDALIIGCYSDPGLDALREMLAIPVIGPGAASLHLAAQLGTRLSVLTPSGRGYGRVAARLRALAISPLLASVRGIGLSVMDLAQQKPGALDKAARRRPHRGGAGRSRRAGARLHEHGFLARHLRGARQKGRRPRGQPGDRRAQDRRGLRLHAAFAQQGGMAGA